MKEIVYVTMQLSNNGADRVASRLITAWMDKGHDVTIVQLAPDCKTDTYSLPEKVKVIDFNSDHGVIMTWINNIINLKKVLKHKQNAAVIAFVNPAIYASILACVFLKNRVIISERNDPYRMPIHKSFRMLRNVMFRWADVCVFQTNDAMQYFSKKVQKKGAIIPNPVDGTLPLPFKGEREKRIVAAGRFTQQKNFSILISAFAKLHLEFPEYILEIYGRGPLKEILENQVKTLGLEQFVLFPGFATDIHEKMLRCSIYVSSSDYQGISNSMLEALAMGIPSVVTDCPIGGAKMTIKNGVNGVLVPVNDVNALYEGMKHILRDSEFAEQLSFNAQNIRSEWPLEKIAERWVQLM